MIWLLVLVGLYLSSLYSYLLFHSLAEFFSIIIAVTLFVIAWNSRDILDNNYLLFLGIGYLFVGCLDLFHTLAYKGMGVFIGHGPNLPTQLWIEARYLEAATLLLAPLFLKRRLNPYLGLGSFALVALLLLLAVFGGIFPTCFVEGTGMTPFKIGSEYLICFMLAGALVLLYRNRHEFHPKVLTLLAWSIALTIAQELSFTLYVHVYGPFNLIGHYLKILSFYLVYKAIIQTGLVHPYDVLFRNLKLREEAIEGLNAELQKRIQEATEHAAELAKANFSLHESKERLRMFIEHAPSSLAMFDKNMRYLSASRRWLNDYNLEDRDLLGLSLYEVSEFPDSWKEAHRRGLGGEVVRVEADRFERADGSVQWLRWEVRPWYDATGGVAGIVIFTENITDRKRAEEALKQAHDELERRVGERTAELRQTVEQIQREIMERQQVEEALRKSEERLRFLASQLLTAQETERKRLALELHDDLGQSLMFLKMQLRGVHKKLPPDLSVAKEGLIHSINYINDVIENVRRMSHDLRPSILEDMGLRAALKSLFREFSKVKKIGFSQDMEDIQGLLSKEAQIAIYRIFQESLTNIAKHAQATEIKVRIKPQDGNVVFQVEDDGNGFNLQELNPGDLSKRGLGLTAMDERVRLLGGELHVSSKPGVGTKIFFSVPKNPQ